MVADIEDGKISTVITKDLSRLGRNYLESGAYIEVFFPKHHVRYIAVNDGVDSANSNGLDITPFKNILNEFYSRDVAKKVKSGKRIRALQGKYMCTTPPFGYDKDPADHNHLIINEEQAAIVRRIYDLALQGWGNNRIAKQLKAEKLPRPAYFKQDKFGKFIKNKEDYLDWTKCIIPRMLRNPLYKGCMWVGAHSKDTFKQAGRGYIKTDERIVVEDTHEPIVTKEEWEQVQRSMDAHMRISASHSTYENIFKGLIKCPDCGKALTFHTDNRRARIKGVACGEPFKKVYFQCHTYRTWGTARCTTHRIEASQLEAAVLADIRKHAKAVVKNPDKYVAKISRKLCVRKSDAIEKNKKRMAKLEDELASFDKLYIKSYEDYSSGIISQERFNLLSGHYAQKQEDCKAEVEKLRCEVDANAENEQAVLKFIEDIKDCAEIEELTAPLLQKLIDKIEVYDAVKGADGKKTQEVKITYRCVGQLS
jgi:DNA invertase Pin-like site-specific DNA recombinase